MIGYWPVCILSNLSETNELLQGKLKLWDDLEIKVQSKHHKLKKLTQDEEPKLEVCLEPRKKKRIISISEEKDQIMDISKRLELDRAEIFNNEDDSSDKNDLELDNLLDQSNNQDENDENSGKLLV